MADRITHLALRTLEDVLARAEIAPVEPSWGVRLALSWLESRYDLPKWQCPQFAEQMADPTESWADEGNARYIRTTALTGMLRAWYRAAGVEEPDPCRRAVLARPYAFDLVDMGVGAPQHPCMCNRYRPAHRDRIAKLFGARPARDFNDGPVIVHPRDPGYVVRLIDGERVIDQMSWGLPIILRGDKGQQLKPRPVNNARFDKLDGKFWQMRTDQCRQRCLIPITAFAEARGGPRAMTTTWLSLIDYPEFAWAGLWGESAEWGSCYTGVMTAAAPDMMDIHDRCPVILRPDEWDTWLNAPFPDLRQFDRAPPAAAFEIQNTAIPWSKGGDPSAGHVP